MITTTINKTDDLDGGPATETITYMFSGRRYEIDLNPENAATFREIMREWVSHSRQAATPKPRPSRTTESRERARAIRAWAQASNVEINTRGRIPQAVILRFENRLG